MGLASVAADLGMHWTINLQTDATAAVGICRRKGLGKIRHLATADLWVQDKLKSGAFTLQKIPGTENPADILTKSIDRPVLVRHLETLGLRREAGRAESAPEIDHASIPMQMGLITPASL